MTATLSSRLSRGYRILLALLCVAVAGAVGPAGRAFADATAASPSPSVSCQVDELDVSSTVGGPTVYAPGQVATMQASVHNPTPVDLADAWFQFQLVAPVGTVTPPAAPTMSWSIDGSDWPGLSLHWEAPGPSNPFWVSGEVALLPTLAAGTTHTLRLQTTFHADSPAGNYPAIVMVGAQICHDQVLGAALGMSFTLYTAEGRAGCCIGNQGGSSSGGAGARKPTSVPPTAPVSATPGAPSASPTDSVNSVVAATPRASATPTQDLASGASTTGPPWIAWLGVLLMLAIAALVSFWNRIVNPGRVRGPARLGRRWRGASRRAPRTATDNPETEPADRNR